MEFKHFDTIVLDSVINKRCCLNWSDDNKFSIIAEDGVHIYELCPLSSDVFTSSLVHSWIAGSSIWSSFDFGVNGQLNNILWTFERTRLCEIAIDSFIPTIGTKTVNNKPRIVETFFSPLISGESYVSCLTENGSLDIYKMTTNNWMPVINVVKEWIDHVMSAETPLDLDFYSYKAKIFQFKIVTHVWSAERERVFLITGHRDGTVCVWNVEPNEGRPSSDGPLKLTPGPRVRADGIPCVLTMERSPSSDPPLSWLFVGIFSGKVKMFVLDDAKQEPVEETESYDVNDSVPPSKINLCRTGGGTHLLVVKHDVVVVRKIASENEEGFRFGETEWFEFPAPIIGLSESVNGDCFYVGLQDHGFRKLEFGSEGRISVRDSDFSFKTKAESDVYCYGIRPSKNKALWIVASSSKITTGNKSAKDYPRLKFFSSSPVRYKSLTDSSGRGLIEKIMSDPSSDVKMIDVADVLELKKSELLAEPSLFRPNHVAATAAKDESLTKLKLLLWEVRLKILCYSVDLVEIRNRLELCIADKKMEERTGSTKFSHLRMDRSEECCVCQESAVRKNFKTSTCLNSHCFPLCSINFSPCNKAPYAFCKYCNSVALLECVSNQENLCIYCDGLLTPDDRLLPRDSFVT